MNCQEFWNTMPELAYQADDGHFEHVRECPACAALLNRQRTLASGLRRLAADWRSVEAPARVESRLTAAFLGQAGLTVSHPATRWWVPVATWATAAAVVVAFFRKPRRVEAHQGRAVFALLTNRIKQTIQNVITRITRKFCCQAGLPNLVDSL